jgi:putative PIN family toxin of toxin-antitoxin system
LRARRAVADTNVWVAAAITPAGVCGRLLQAAIAGNWDPVVSPLLLAELEDVLARPKFRRWLTEGEARQFVGDLMTIAHLVDDPAPQAGGLSADPDDEFLVALAQAADVEALVSGDPHLLDLELEPPVVSPAAYLGRLDS